MSNNIGELVINVDTTQIDVALEKAERLQAVLDQIADHSCLKDLDAFIRSSIRNHSARRG